MLPPLATLSDAADYGYESVSDAALSRASSRVRGELRQQMSAGTSTVVGMGPLVTLPERPVTAVMTVKDADGRDVPFTLSGADVETSHWGPLTITYAHGLTALPDEVVELVCAIASRITNAAPQVAQGVASESAGPHSITFGMDAWKAQSGLTAGEKETLRRYWPKMPRTISMGSAATIRAPRSPLTQPGAFDV